MEYLAMDQITCKILTEGWADRLDEIAEPLFGKASGNLKTDESEANVC